MHSSCNGRQRHIHIHPQVRSFSLPRFCLYELKGWFAFILPFKACSCNCRGTVANAQAPQILTCVYTLTHRMHVKCAVWKSFPWVQLWWISGMRMLGQWDAEKEDGKKTEGRREGWVHPGVILSCPRNFPPNTRKSLSDQQPNSSSASCAGAPHASSRLFPNTASHSLVDAVAGWFTHKCFEQ